MLSKKKWIFAFVFVLMFFLLNRLETSNVLSTNYSTTLLAPQQPKEAYNQIKAWVQQSDKKITVSAPITTPPLVEYKSIQPYEDGVILSIDSKQDLFASENGLIIFTGYTKKTGKTLSISYDTGETATYGFVEKFHQLPYTTINTGDIFASAADELLYIQVEKDGEYLDTSELVEWLSASDE